MKVLLAMDGSGHSEATVHELARQHFPAATEVRIISVVEPPHFAGSSVESGAGAGLYVQLDNYARERAHAAVDKTAATLKAAVGSRSLNVTTKILSGQATGSILDEAEAFGADLIVVGSHGHGTFGRFLIGSVAHAVALHATCSVEIVRSPKTPATKSESR